MQTHRLGVWGVAVVLATAGMLTPFVDVDGAAADPEEQILPVDQTLAPGFRVEVSCSKTELRTPLATLSWQVTLDEAKNQRVDVTVFKHGFGAGYFASLSPVSDAGKFVPSTGLAQMGRKPGKAFDIVASQPRFDPDTGVVRLEVKPLEPSVLYEWRVLRRAENSWRQSQSIKVGAPVCVADMVKEN